MRRKGLILFLLAGAALLLAAVFIGNRMGDRVIGQVGQRVDLQPSFMPTAGGDPDPEASGPVFWKKSKVVTAATDPGFPDPRVTPAPSPTPRPATPSPTPTAVPEETPLPTLGPGVTTPPTALLTPVPAPSAAASAASGGSAPNESGTTAPAATK